jgi:hypothetical protein
VSDELVMNRFRLLERIGSGGMGTVYRAFDERLQRHVAVKEIQLAGADRVMREAQAAARLNHPAIVTLYELGERDGHALLVSELVDGSTFDELCQQGSISDREVARFGADVCDALAHAHSRGVVHRDVKPQNVIVADLDAPGARAKLMDFGIASVAGAPTLTAPGSVLGTLAYMAPEQAEGEKCGPEADVYALGLMLYEAWAGENPVAGDNAAQTARRIGREHCSLAEYRPDLPGALIAHIDGCLEPQPLDRPELDELQGALRNSLSALDPDAAVPHEGEHETEGVPARSLSGIFATIGIGVFAAALAGPAGLPGLALIAALLFVPAMLVVRNPLSTLLALLAIPAGAIGALLVVPAVIAVAVGNARERLVLGGLAFAAYLGGAISLGSGSRLGLAPPAPSGWTHSAATASSALLEPLADPSALLGIAICALAAMVLGKLLQGSLAVALIGGAALAAGLETGLAALGDGGLGEHPALALATVGAALLFEWRLRELADGRRPRLASARPALHGGG